MSHTYAVLDVSSAVYREIRQKLKAAGYDHAIHRDERGATGSAAEVIDMHGIALAEEMPT